MFPRLYRLETNQNCLVYERKQNATHPRSPEAYGSAALVSLSVPQTSTGPMGLVTPPGLNFQWAWRRDVRTSPEIEEFNNLLLGHMVNLFLSLECSKLRNLYDSVGILMRFVGISFGCCERNPDVVKEKADFVKEKSASVKKKAGFCEGDFSNVPTKLHKDKVDKEAVADKASVQDDPGNSSSVVVSKDKIKGVNDKVLDVVAKDKPNGSTSSVVVSKDKRKESSEKEARILKLKWKTKANVKDCGIFTMLHMDPTRVHAKIMDCGLVAESKQQCDMLRQLRLKFATKILLHEINVHAQKMIRYAEQFDKIMGFQKMCIVVDALKNGEEREKN
ncbi:hypothetical protein Tco_1523643 [Tanacetum coccineum]